MVMPFSRITLSHFAISLLSSWPSSSGEVGDGEMAFSANLRRMSGSFTAAVKAALSLAMISGGVPLGTEMPFQTLTSYPGTVSPMVGTSGNASERLAAVTPSARSLPALICAIEHIRSGRLRPLGVTALKRSDALPDVPTIGETVPGYEVNVWNGIVVPRGTPPDIIDTLNRAVNAVLADPRLQARFAELGGAPMPMTPAQFGELVIAETEKWAKVVKLSGAKPD